MAVLPLLRLPSFSEFLVGLHGYRNGHGARGSTVLRPARQSPSWCCPPCTARTRGLILHGIIIIIIIIIIVVVVVIIRWNQKRPVYVYGYVVIYTSAAAPMLLFSATLHELTTLVLVFIAPSRHPWELHQAHWSILAENVYRNICREKPFNRSKII